MRKVSTERYRQMKCGSMAIALEEVFLGENLRCLCELKFCSRISRKTGEEMPN